MQKIEMLFQNKDGEMLPNASQLSALSESSEYRPHESGRYINIKPQSSGYYYRNINDEGTLVETRKQLPLLYSHRYECSGCTACMSVCPRSGSNHSECIRCNKKDEVFQFKYKLSKTGVTYNVEHNGAITMLPDEEGFLYPVVDAEVCIRCYKCIDVCPLK